MAAKNGESHGKCTCSVEAALKQIPWPANVKEQTLFVPESKLSEAEDSLWVSHLRNRHGWHVQSCIGDPPPLRSGIPFDPELRTGTRRIERAKTDTHEFNIGDRFKAVHSGSVLSIRSVQTRHETGKDKGKKLPNPIYIMHHENQATDNFPMNEVTIKANLKLAWNKI